QLVKYRMQGGVSRGSEKFFGAERNGASTTPATENRACRGPRSELASCCVLIVVTERRSRRLSNRPQSTGRLCPLVRLYGVVSCNCLRITANLHIIVLINSEAAKIDRSDLACVHVRDGVHLLQRSCSELGAKEPCKVLLVQCRA